MNFEEQKPLSFKERWNQIFEAFFTKLNDAKPENEQAYNEVVMLDLFGEKLINLLNEYMEKIRKIQSGMEAHQSAIVDHEQVLAEQLKALREAENVEG